MVQKSCYDVGSLVYPIIYKVFLYIPGGDRRISEPLPPPKATPQEIRPY